MMIEGYKKLINDLELHRRLKEAFLTEYEYNKKLFYKNAEMNTRATINNKPIDRVVEDLRYYENLMYIEDENIKNMEAKIKAIDECIDQSDITIKVAQLRALGMTQEAVAELIDRSDRQVRNIEKKIKENK